jgi:hypothetical protein
MNLPMLPTGAHSEKRGRRAKLSKEGRKDQGIPKREKEKISYTKSLDKKKKT